MKVVLATNDRKTLNGHFALSKTFLFYDISDNNSELINEMDFIDTSLEHRTGYEQKKPFSLEERLNSI